MRFRKDYKKQMFDSIIKLLDKNLERERAAEAKLVFVSFNRALIDAKIIDLDNIAQLFKKHGYSYDEAALAMIDTTITQMRVHISNNPNGEVNEQLERAIADYEQVIDSVMERTPGRILPRNGQFAKLAEKYGMDKFFKEEF